MSRKAGTSRGSRGRSGELRWSEELGIAEKPYRLKVMLSRNPLCVGERGGRFTARGSDVEPPVFRYGFRI